MEPAPKPRLPPKISSALADNEADGNSDYNDDFEKEDMVKAGLSIPLHPGAEKYYKEVGLLK